MGIIQHLHRGGLEIRPYTLLFASIGRYCYNHRSDGGSRDIQSAGIPEFKLFFHFPVFLEECQIQGGEKACHCIVISATSAVTPLASSSRSTPPKRPACAKRAAPKRLGGFSLAWVSCSREAVFTKPIIHDSRLTVITKRRRPPAARRARDEDGKRFDRYRGRLFGCNGSESRSSRR